MDLMVFREITHWWERNSFDIGFGITLIIKNYNKIRLVTKTIVFHSFITLITLLKSLKFIRNYKTIIIN